VHVELRDTGSDRLPVRAAVLGFQIPEGNDKQ
jgi:hypothetical protein